jgi:hypothetical protein
MKLHASTHNVDKSGNFEESKFSIEASSKAFFILSDGLYSNKVLAVVRELSTNAYDSHVEAGKADVPFDVHLPTTLNPVFFIRDYGTSMNHEDCMQLYTTYFRSTRNNSNDAVGCLGLGSKAPFAYSDSFVVEAYLDGICRTYNAHKDSGGNPTFVIMNETETSEPNGIKVSISVNSYDVNRFKVEANKVYEYFKIKPNFVGGEKLVFNKPDKILAGDNWYFDDNESSNLIIMGQIAYPLDGSQLSNNSDNNKYRRFVDYSNGLRIFVNIGDVDITPSRESLSYSRETKENICKIIDKIISDIKVKIEQEIKSQPTLFKARIKYIQMSDQCHSIKNAMESLQNSILWNDIKLFDNAIGEYIDVKKKITCNKLSKGNYRKKIDTEYNVERFYFSRTIKFVIDNLTRGGVSRLKQYMKESGDSMHCYIYKLGANEIIDNCVLLDMMGGASKEDVIITSDLPKVVNNRNYNTSGDNGPAIQIQVYNEELGRFEDCTMSVKYENAYYFSESKGSVNVNGRNVDMHSIEKTLAYIHEDYSDDIDGMSFYAVKPSVIKNRKLEERDNWKSATQIVCDIISRVVEENKADIINAYRRIGLSNEHNQRWAEVFVMTQTDNEVKRIINEYNEYTAKIQKNMDAMRTIQSIAESFNVKSIDFSNIELNDNTFAQRFDKEFKKYPMLKMTSLPWRDTDKKIVADYIDMIEHSENMTTVLSSI